MKFCGGVRAAGRVAGLFAFIFAAGSPSVALCADAAVGVRILYAEPLRIAVPASGDAQRKPGAALRKLQLSAYGREYTLSVDANETFHDSLALKASRSSLKLYRGAIDGLQGSWVRLATHGRDVHGMLWDGAHVYAIAPSAQVQAQLVSPQQAAGETVIFRLSDVLIDSQSVSCAAGSVPQTQRASDAYDALVKEITRAGAQNKLYASMRLELSALGDSPYLGRYASEQEARDAILLRLNNVDGIFSSQLGVQIQVPTVQVHTPDSDPFSGATQASSLLGELAALRRNSTELRSRGLTHLFTGRDLDGTTIGIAYMDALCDPKHGVGLTQTLNHGSWYESLIAAHEIGHNFGAVHDGESGKACASTPQNLFLMSPNVSGADTFSQCSLQLMQPNVNHAMCIAPLPPADVSIPGDLDTLSRAVGTSFDWDLSVANTGGADAVDVRAELLVPPVVAVEDAYVTGGSCTSGAGVIQCQLGDIAGGTSRAVHLRLRSDVVGSNSISAQVFAQTESVTSNNAGEGTIVIDPEADVSIVIDSPAQAPAMDFFDVRFTVANAAVIDAMGLRTVIRLPAGFSAERPALDGADCTVGEMEMVCTLASLAPGTSSDGVVSLAASQAGTAMLRVEVSGSYVDPDPANDSAETSIQITAAAAGAEQATTGSASGGGGAGNPFWLACLALSIFARHSNLRRILNSRGNALVQA
jgi:hypothetical protein